MRVAVSPKNTTAHLGQGERKCQDLIRQDQWDKDPVPVVVSDCAPAR